jgi:hypothetical protein
MGPAMKKEYDFSKAERGRVYHKNAELGLPIYLGARLQKRVESLAARTGDQHARRLAVRCDMGA